MAPTAFDSRALTCPGCRGELTPDFAAGEVSCSGCDRVYPLRDGVPILLLGEAAHRARASPLRSGAR